MVAAELSSPCHFLSLPPRGRSFLMIFIGEGVNRPSPPQLLIGAEVYQSTASVCKCIKSCNVWFYPGVHTFDFCPGQRGRDHIRERAQNLQVTVEDSFAFTSFVLSRGWKRNANPHTVPRIPPVRDERRGLTL